MLEKARKGYFAYVKKKKFSNEKHEKEKRRALNQYLGPIIMK